MKKIAILTNIIPPYRLPLFNGIAKTHKVDVLTCKESEKNREWKTENANLFHVVQLQGFELTLRNSLGDYRFIYLKFTVIFYLLFKRPDYIIIGDASLTSYLAAFTCKVLKIKYIWWNEILPFTPISKGFIDKLRSFSIQHAHHHFVSGTLAKEFIQSYDIKENNISIIPDAVDNDLYINYYHEFKNDRDALRASYDINKDDFVFLYVGQFIKRKNLILLLKAFKEAKIHDFALKLFLVGGGEDLEEIIKFIENNNLQDSINIKEFLQTEELSKIYTLSDSLVLISESEPWGMVVNEAMCFGLPVLASYTVGASADLVDVESGIIVDDYKDVKRLSQSLLDTKSKQWSKKYIQNKVLNWNNEVAIGTVDDNFI